jgi:hypothetical protein
MHQGHECATDGGPSWGSFGIANALSSRGFPACNAVRFVVEFKTATLLWSDCQPLEDTVAPVQSMLTSSHC